MSPPTPPATRIANIRSVQPLKLPIGVTDFGKLVSEGFTFVDKTPMIGEVIHSGAEVTLITRPRRFGKTLNLSMLQHFFAERVTGAPTAGLFEGLAITRDSAAMAHQGHYPVIFFTFKDIKDANFDAFERSFREKLSNLFHQHIVLQDSPRLEPSRRSDVEALLTEKADLAKMANAFLLLSELLHKHYGRRVIILLDEYDTPLQAAYEGGFYQPLAAFIRNLLGAALKDNPYLYKAVLTGILRVSEESLFSELNNLKVHTVLDQRYSACFGFTEPEVSGLLQATGLAAQQPALDAQIRGWYNGYRFGREVIYNPWSIVNCLDEHGVLKPYWVRTSGSSLLKKLMAQADAAFKESLEGLIQGGTVEEIVDPNLVLGQLAGNADGDARALWSLLLFSGYLTALSSEPAGTHTRCQLAIPNQEIRHLYEDIIMEWFRDTLHESGYRRFLNALVTGDLPEFETILREYLLRSASFFDVQDRNPERFYHGLVLGMIVGLRDTHVIHSNRESGRGRYDVALFPKVPSAAVAPGILIEFKHTSNPGQLTAAAEAALAQIETQHYDAEPHQHAVERILSMGIAFCGKELALAHRWSSIS